MRSGDREALHLDNISTRRLIPDFDWAVLVVHTDPTGAVAAAGRGNVEIPPSQEGIASLLRESRQAARDFRDLSRSLKQNPSQLIYEPNYRGVEVAK